VWRGPSSVFFANSPRPVLNQTSRPVSMLTRTDDPVLLMYRDVMAKQGLKSMRRPVG